MPISQRKLYSSLPLGNLPTCLYLQRAASTVIGSDSLSRDFHIPSSNLSSLLLSHFPKQAPFGLTILPLPPNIGSWLTCLLHSQQQMEHWSKESTRSKFALGIGSNYTSFPLDSKMTPTLTASIKPSESKSSVPLLTPLEKVEMAINLLICPSNPNLLEPSWTAWLRPSRWLTELTPDWMGTRNLHTFYNGSYGDTYPQTHLQDHKLS